MSRIPGFSLYRKHSDADRTGLMAPPPKTPRFKRAKECTKRSCTLSLLQPILVSKRISPASLDVK